MTEAGSQSNNPLQSEEGSASTLPRCEEKTPADVIAPEFDHRGIQLPARSRVGGIIIPQ